MSAGRGLRRVSQNTSILSRSFTKVCPNVLPRSIARNRLDEVSWSSHRLYSSQIDRRDSKEGSQDVEQPEEAFNITLEEEMLAIQNKSIAELEKLLGKSLEQAVLQDGLADRLISSRKIGMSDSDLEATAASEFADRRFELEIVRIQGGSPEEVAREARSIFGDYLPDGSLKKEELVVYTRLYGAPAPDPNTASARALLAGQESVDDDSPQGNTLLDADGSEIEYHIENKEDAVPNDGTEHSTALDQGTTGVSLNQALDTSDRAAELAMALEGEVIDEDYELEDDEDIHDTRSHPLTGLGRFTTSPSTKFFSHESFVRPVEEMLDDFSNKQLKDVCEKTFGGPGLPDSAFTPRSGRSRQQVPIPLGANQQVMGQMQANAFVTTIMPPTYASLSAVLVETRKRLGSTWLTNLLAKEGGPRILDAGSGGVGILAWREIVQAHWDSLHSSDSHPPPPPRSKSVVLTGSDTLRSRAAKMLDNTTFVPRLPDYIHARQTPTIDDERPVQQRKQFDVVMSSHTLFSLKEEWERKQYIQNLWSLLDDTGGVLVLVEKGIPRGFETIAAARDMILERYIATPPGHSTAYPEDMGTPLADTEMYQKAPGMIIAPCTNHEKCPLYTTSGISKGRKDVCSFQQRYIRPPFLQRILGAKDRNHDDVDFSYIAIMKGDDLRTRDFTTWEHVQDPLSAPPAPRSRGPAGTQSIAASEIQQGFEYYDPTVSDPAPPPPTHVLPRVMNAPLKRRGHVTMDLCTPQAEIRRWTVPKSFSRQAYRDARKARWGDLWALGAKTSIARNLKLGTPMKDYVKGEGMENVPANKKPRSRAARLEAQVERAMIAEEEKRSEEELEEAEFMRVLEEDNLLDEDDEDGTIDMDTLLPRKSARSQTPPQTPNRSRSGARQMNGRPASRLAQNTPSASPILEDDPVELHGRMGQSDALSAWAEELENTRLEDEARKRVSRSGRRATAKNTQRVKRDLRRAQRKDQDLDDVE